MKAMGRSVHNEVYVASTLSKIMPRHFLKLVAAQEARELMLMEDYGEPLTTEKSSLK